MIIFPTVVYTIGDCYIVMGFSDANRRDPLTEAKNVVEMGFSMIESLHAFRKEQVEQTGIDMRIGIHIVRNSKNAGGTVSSHWYLG